MEPTDLRNKNARWVLILFLSGWVLAIIWKMGECHFPKIVSIYAMPVILIFGLWASIRFLKGAEFHGKLDIVFISIAALYNFGAQASDLIGTYYHIPTLAAEANPIARYLLDVMGVSVGFVYVYGGAGKILLGVVESILWIGLIGHRRALLAAIEPHKANGLFSYLKAAIGGGHQSWRAFFLPLRLRELHRAFHIALLFIIMLGGTNIYIWLIWIWRLPSESSANGLSFLILLAAYLVYLVINYYPRQKIKRNVLISVSVATVLFLLFAGYHYVRFLQATSRMQELSADLEKRITEWEKKEYKRPPLFGPAIPGNAVEFYKKAAKEDKSRKLDFEVRMQMDYAEKSPDTPISPELKAALALYKDAFEMVKQGANAETYKPLIDWHGEPWNYPDTRYGALRMLTQLMVVHSRELVKEDKSSDTLRLCCSFIRLGDDTARRGGIIDGLVGIALSSMSQVELLRLLNNTELSEPQMAELIAALNMLIDSEISFTGLCESEQLYIEALLRHLAKSYGLLPKDNEMGVGPSFINRTGIVDSWGKYIPAIKELVRISSLPYAQMVEELDKFNKQVESLDPVSQILLPSLGNLHVKHYMLKAQRRGLYILAVLKLYQARHQKYPDKLSDLAPDIIKEVPLDPFSDQPFIYKVNQDGTIMLYSVGKNLKDDNGTSSRFNEADIVIAPYLRWNERK